VPRSATSSQIVIAMQYGIPQKLAYTINIKKYGEYCKYLASPMARLEAWLDRQSENKGYAEV
jgi:hypothetical protein